jgi:hypothetical protein
VQPLDQRPRRLDAARSRYPKALLFWTGPKSALAVLPDEAPKPKWASTGLPSLRHLHLTTQTLAQAGRCPRGFTLLDLGDAWERCAAVHDRLHHRLDDRALRHAPPVGKDLKFRRQPLGKLRSDDHVGWSEIHSMRFTSPPVIGYIELHRIADDGSVLNEQDLDAYLKRGSLVLCHVTAEESVPAIQRDGLRPGSDVGKTTRDDFFKPRDGRVYLIAHKDVPIVEVTGEPRVFSVDLEKLDPALMDPDEDIVAHHLASMVGVTPPQRECDENGEELPGQIGALAAWADDTEGFDRSEVTQRSLSEHGRISYRGTIPPSALALLDIRSQPLAMFIQGLDPEIGEQLPEPPPASTWRTEVRRACVLLTKVAGGISEAVGHPIECDASDVYKARDTSDRLRKVVSHMYQREGRFPEGAAVHAVQEAMDFVGEFTEYAPVSDLMTAQQIGDTTATALNKLADSAIRSENTKSIAVEALAHAAACGPG